MILRVEGLKTYFHTYEGTVRALEGIDLEVRSGETVGLVGETGCGKSVTALSVLRLIPSPPGKIEAGRVFLEEPAEVRSLREAYDAKAAERLKAKGESGRTSDAVKTALGPEIADLRARLAAAKAEPEKARLRTELAAATSSYDLLQKPDEEMRKIRGNKISMIFQEPMTALNPVFTVGDQIAETLILHRRNELCSGVIKSLERFLGPQPPKVKTVRATVRSRWASSHRLRVFPLLCLVLALAALALGVVLLLNGDAAALFAGNFLMGNPGLLGWVLLVGGSVGALNSVLLVLLFPGAWRQYTEVGLFFLLGSLLSLSLIGAAVSVAFLALAVRFAEEYAELSEPNARRPAVPAAKEALLGGRSADALAGPEKAAYERLEGMKASERVCRYCVQPAHAIWDYCPSCGRWLVVDRAGPFRRRIMRTELNLYRRMLKDPDDQLVDFVGTWRALRGLVRNRLRDEGNRWAVDLLREVRIPEPETVAGQYPFELSGGMRQRSMIAMMMACNPKLLIADEPTTALDVTVEAQILKLMKELQAKTDMAILLITHDLGIVAEVCDKVGVMYAGSIAEFGTAEQIFHRTRHPYTSGLMQSIPRFKGATSSERKRDLYIIKGSVPNLLHPPAGCRFHPRCPRAVAQCGWTADEIAAELAGAEADIAAKLEATLKDRGKAPAGADAANEAELKAALDRAAQLRDLMHAQAKAAAPRGGKTDTRTLVVPAPAGMPSADLVTSLRGLMDAQREQRLAFKAVDAIEEQAGSIVIRLHEGVEPRLVEIEPGNLVACHNPIPTGGEAA